MECITASRALISKVCMGCCWDQKFTNVFSILNADWSKVSQTESNSASLVIFGASWNSFSLSRPCPFAPSVWSIYWLMLPLMCCNKCPIPLRSWPGRTHNSSVGTCGLKRFKRRFCSFNRPTHAVAHVFSSLFSDELVITW